MTDMDVLLRVIDELTSAEKQQIIDHIKRHQEKASTERPVARIPGLFPGIWMSDDFDDELPDSFWLGEE